MMIPAIQVILASFVLGAVVSYLWWVRFRVWALRQDLFEIRDRLWDQMRTAGALDHPAHREIRVQLNSLIRLAPMLSLMTVFHMFLTHERFGSLLGSGDRPPEVEQARHDIMARLAFYLLYESLMGLALVLFIRLSGMYRTMREGFTRMIGWLIDARVFGEVDHSLSLSATQHLTSV